MARILQLLRSNTVYTANGNTSAKEVAKAAVQALTNRKDGEVLVARYQESQSTPVKSLLCIYHCDPDLTDVTPGWTFIEDASTGDAGIQGLQTEVDAIERGVGLGIDGSYTAPSVTTYLGSTTSVVNALTTLDTAIDGIADNIAAMDENENYSTSSDAVVSDGKVITAVKQVDGAVSALSSDLSDLKLAGYVKTNNSGAIAATDSVEVALSKLENNIDAINGVDLLAAGDAIDIAQGTGTNADKTVISAKYDNDTITLNNSGQLQTALTLNYNAAVTTDDSEAPATITLQTTGANPTVLGTVNVSSIIGNGILSTSSYDPTTGILTLTFANANGTTTPVQVDLTDLFDVDDIAVKNDSTDFLTFAPVSPEAETGQALIGVKLADVTYTATSGSTPASLTVNTTNGKLLDASDAIPAISSYVADVLSNASTNLAVTADAVNNLNGTAMQTQPYVDAIDYADDNTLPDNKHVRVTANVVTMANATSSNTGLADAYDVKDYVATQLSNTAISAAGDSTYIAAAVDGTNNKKINVTGYYGVFNTPTAGSNTLSAATNGIAKAEDVATAVNTVVGNLDGSATATAASGNVYTVLTGVSQTDGLISKGGEVTLAAAAKTGAAADVTYANTTSGLTATTVQTAIDEVKGRVDTLETTAGNALQSISGSNAITVGTEDANHDQSVSLKLDAVTGDSTDAQNQYSANGNALQITSNGLFLSDVWDCGTYGA